MNNLRKKTILDFTTFLMKESRKNYIGYTIHKNEENTQLTYENSSKKKITIFTSPKNFHISFPNGGLNKYEISKEGITNAKRDLLKYAII